MTPLFKVMLLSCIVVNGLSIKKEECVPCDTLFSKLKPSGEHGKFSQEIVMTERGEPKTGTTIQYVRATAALVHACDYLKELFGVQSCTFKDEGSFSSIIFEPEIGRSEAKCPCENIEKVSISIGEHSKHRIPVVDNCPFSHVNDIDFRFNDEDTNICTFADGTQVKNLNELWTCVHESNCKINDKSTQMAVFRDPRTSIVSTFYYIKKRKDWDIGDLDTFVMNKLELMCQWLVIRYILFTGIMADQSVEFWYDEITEDLLNWNYHWFYTVGLQLPYHIVNDITKTNYSSHIDFHPGEHNVRSNSVRRFEDEVSEHIVEFSNEVLRKWLPPVLLERFGVTPVAMEHK